MMNFRISKYNPVFRDEYGCYTREEWTSISDVDKEICGVKLSLGGYLNIEDKYITALNFIFDDLKIKGLYVMQLEKHTTEIQEDYVVDGLTDTMINIINSVEEGQELNLEKIGCIIKANLREMLWCSLYSKITHMIIKPGYDFYINVICPQISQNTIANINSLGLYIEIL